MIIDKEINGVCPRCESDAIMFTDAKTHPYFCVSCRVWFKLPKILIGAEES